MKRGALVRLLPSLRARAGIIHAVFPTRRGMIPAVRALLDFLAESIEAARLLERIQKPGGAVRHA
jgi:DNA-binding transcriptional LysR family regulator